MHVWLYTCSVILRFWSKRLWLAHIWGLNLLFFFTDGAWTSQSRPTVHELALFWPLLKCSYVLLLIWLNLYKNLIFYRENMKDNLWQFIYKKYHFRYPVSYAFKFFFIHHSKVRKGGGWFEGQVYGLGELLSNPNIENISTK